MNIRRTYDSEICYISTDGVALWCYDIVEFRVYARNRKFIMTPIMRDGSEGPSIDTTEMYERFLRE